MALNYIWIAFFMIAFVLAIIKLIFFGDTEIFNRIVEAIFDRAKIGFELSLGLTGVLVLWMGIMKIGEKGGVVQTLSRWLSPLFTKLFPEIPKNHPAIGSMMMNMSANVLGLDNAATPLGLKAMKELQTLNPKEDTASNAQIMFLVLNASSLTLIPVSILALRASSGSVNPTDIFVPILIATFFSTLTGLVVTSVIQRINLFQKTILLYLGSATVVLITLMYYLQTLRPEQMQILTKLLANGIIFGLIVSFIVVGLYRKINVYDAFIEGAKGGFDVAITIVPYLVAMLVAIGVFTASGAMELVMSGLRTFFSWLHFDTRFVEALPTALMKPLSGGGARGLMVESWQTYGVDSFVGHLTSIIQGSTETTFYVLAVYFGSVNIKKTRYAVWVGLLADLAGALAAIWVTYLFFGHLI